MLIKETKSSPSILEQLNEAVYLTQEESTISPAEITVRENSNLDCNTVLYEDVLRISDQYDCSLNEAIEKIAEANDIPSCLLAVDLKEDMAILYPEVVDEMYQVVISPMSENDPIGVYVESVVNEAIEKDDESIIESAFLTEGTANKIANALIGAGAAGVAGATYGFNKKAKHWQNLGGKYGAELGQFRDPNAIDDRTDLMDLGKGSGILMAIGGGIKVGDRTADKIGNLYDKYKNRPKNVIAKVIAKLRSVYEKVKNRMSREAESGKSGLFKKDSKVVNTLKKVAAKILTTIDKLMTAMQKTANQFS
jgi:hypothetical protein